MTSCQLYQILTFESGEQLAAERQRWTTCRCSLQKEDRLTEFHSAKNRRMTGEEANSQLRNFTNALSRLLNSLVVRLDSPVRARKIKTKLNTYDVKGIAVADRRTNDAELHGFVTVFLDHPESFVQLCMSWFRLQHLPWTAMVLPRSIEYMNQDRHAKTIIQFPNFPALLIQRLRHIIDAASQPAPSSLNALHQIRILSKYLDDLFTNDPKSPLYGYLTPHAHRIFITIYDIIHSFKPSPPRLVQDMLDMMLPPLLHLGGEMYPSVQGNPGASQMYDLLLQRSCLIDQEDDDDDTILRLVLDISNIREVKRCLNPPCFLTSQQGSA
ncbi:hypothetical protein BDV98DRAFT_561243 [Pterulicium gracile]|uniref:Uncharacterized protein n=1 Tax=Pterulicium gracile TaxID=1884261 RepID=A0A5C3QSU9_9AGAR|nr:hypothetical protein BDV98DRAFT_561243 [Pterula gracilis]